MSTKFKYAIALVIIAAAATAAAVWLLWPSEEQKKQVASPQLKEKVYVALEGEGKVAVINPETNEVYKKIDLSKPGGESFSAHNVQVAPSGQSVWVTAVAREEPNGAGDMGDMEGMQDMEMGPPDEAVVIDPKSDEIINRIPVATGAHLAHVVLAPVQSYAYISAQEENAIYKIKAGLFTVDKRIPAPPQSQPHGMRMTPDGKTVYIAYLEGKALGVLDTKTDQLGKIDLDGAAVQTGVTANGKFVVVSLYDTKKIGVLEISTGKLSYIDLPPESKGPVQLYPTPDSKFVYVADQGYYFDQPTGENVYKIDLSSMKVVKTIRAGQGPHGVVVSKDGRRVYVANIVSNDVSVIDTATDQETARISVGEQPNGISMWTDRTGGTP